MKVAYLGALVLAVTVAAVPAFALTPRGEGAAIAAVEEKRGITVSGTGRVSATPDVSEWSFGVYVRRASAREALASAAARMRGMVAALRRAGVAREDIRTEAVELWADVREPGTVAGYEASTNVVVVVRGLARTGTVVDAAVRAGANEVFGPGLSSSNREELHRRALADAYDEARRKAEALASTLGVSLGAPVAVVEASPESGFERTMAAAELSAPEIEPGTMEIAATVSVTFAIS